MLQLPPFRYQSNNAALYAGTAVPLPNLDLDFTTGTLDPRITFTRASVGTYFDSAGVLRTATSNTARFDYDPVTLAARGLLVEESRGNILTNSEDFTHAVYTKTGVTVTANQTTSPDGTGNADLITASASPAWINSSAAAPAGVAYAQSIFAKKGSSDWIYMLGQVVDSPRAWFNLNTGAVGTVGAGITSAHIQDVGNGWYRCVITDVGSTGAEPLTVGLCDGDNSTTVTVGRTIYLWGAQHEGTSVSSYIPTAAVTATRAADVAVMTGTNFSSWFNQSAGTFVAEFAVLVASQTTRAVVTADDGSAANQILLYGNITDAKGRMRVSAATTADIVAGTLTANVPHKLALSYAVNDIAACFNGGTVGTDTVNPTLPIAPTQLRIGWEGTAVDRYLNGHIRRVRFWNTAKSDAEMQALTT